MPSLRNAVRRMGIAATGTLLAIAAFGAGPAAADSGCTKVASPSGSDSAAGTEAAPYGTVQRLVNSLGAGDVGCLRAGDYHENVTIGHGGSGDSSQLVLHSYPGERAKISGRLYVTDNADWVTVEQLDLDGHDSPTCSSTPICRLPSPTVNGDHDTFQDLDVTNDHLGICFNLGNAGYGRAVADVIRRNRIHDCGTLPANNHEHGIYLSYADDTQILDNVIYDNADRGIQLYPDAQRTVVRGNVIDGNGVGVIFSGVGDSASNNSLVENNIITNSRIRHDVESWYPDLTGSGNVVRNNCIHGGAEGEIASGPGFSATQNLNADPQYVDRAGKDFRLAPGSPCAGVLDGASIPAGSLTKGSSSPRTGSAAGGTLVTVQQATLRRTRHGHRWVLKVRGRVHGAHGSHRAYVELRRGGSWQRLAARQIHGTFRVSVDPRIPAFHGARVTKVRVVVPGVGKSRAVAVHVLG